MRRTLIKLYESSRLNRYDKNRSRTNQSRRIKNINPKVKPAIPRKRLGHSFKNDSFQRTNRSRTFRDLESHNNIIFARKGKKFQKRDDRESFMND